MSGPLAAAVLLGLAFGVGAALADLVWRRQVRGMSESMEIIAEDLEQLRDELRAHGYRYACPDCDGWGELQAGAGRELVCQRCEGLGTVVDG